MQEGDKSKRNVKSKSLSESGRTNARRGKAQTQRCGDKKVLVPQSNTSAFQRLFLVGPLSYTTGEIHRNEPRVATALFHYLFSNNSRI